MSESQKKIADNVVDIFSKKSLVKLSASPAVSISELERLGEYQGKFPRPAAKKIRHFSTLLVTKETVIDSLMKEYGQLYEQYQEEFEKNLSLLELKLEEGRKFFISEEGNIWMAASEDLPKFTAFMETN